MRCGFRLAVVGALLLCAAVGFAQQQRGDVELQFMGMYSQTVGSDYRIGMGNISAKIGPYITDALQVGVGPTLTISTVTTHSFNYTTLRAETRTETNTTFGCTAFLVYSFLMKGAKAVPYLGAQYYKTDFSNTDDKGSMGINGGLKYYFARKTAVDVSGNYLFPLTSGQEGGTILFAVGLSFLF